jgi:hypothetical protein
VSALATITSIAGAVGLAALRWTPVLALAALAARRRGASSGQRHALWAGALLALASMPPAAAGLPRWVLPLPAVTAGGTPASPHGSPPGGPRAAPAAPGRGGEAVREAVPGVGDLGPRAPGALALLWLAGAVLLAAGELAQALATRRLVRSARELVPHDALRAHGGEGWRGWCRTAPVPVPAVAGLLRPCILLPETWQTWPRRWLRAVLLHEAAHVERRDLAWQLLARWVRVVFWFHPGVWLAARRLASEAEAACDDLVVARGVDPVAYARVLLEVATAVRSRALPSGALGAVARPSQLGQRVRRLLAPEPLPRAGRRLGAAALLACGLLVATAEPSRSLPRGAASGGRLALREVGAGAGWVLRCDPGDLRCMELNGLALRALRDAGAPGAVLVSRVADGRVEAFASRGVAGGPQPGMPAAAPGSLAKLALLAAWWEEGMGDPLLPCPASVRTSQGARVEALDGGRALLTPRGVLARSCNTGAVAMARELGRRGGAMALPVALDPLLGGASRRRPDLDWELQASGIGPLTTTPLRVAAFLHAVAGEGLAVEPWALEAPVTPPRRLFGAGTAARLRDALADAVRDGTARGLGELQTGQRWRLTGKTGTVLRPDGRADGWFAGIVADEAGRPERVVVVWLAGGGPGAGRPGRLALDLGRAARG